MATRQRAFWDAVALTKVFSHPLDLARFRGLVERSAKILDYGCGYGRLGRELAAAGFVNVHGVDASPCMIERACAENSGLTFDLLDGALGFPDESFDAVLLFSVLTCIVDDAGQRRVVEDIARVLRPNGILYVSDILLQDDERNRARYDQVRLKADTAYADVPYGLFQLDPGVWFRHLSRSWIDELFGGFERIELRELPVTTMNGNPAKGFQYFGRKPRW